MGENMENMKLKLEIFLFILEKFTDDHLVEFSSYYLSTLTDNCCRDILTERNRSNNLQCTYVHSTRGWHSLRVLW